MKKFVVLAVLIGLVFAGQQWYQYKKKQIMVPIGIIPQEVEGLKQIEIEGPLDISQLAVPGRPTVIDFCTESCPGCRVMHDSHYPAFLKLRPDVVLLYVRLSPDWSYSDLWRRHGIKVDQTPHIIIIGPDGKVIADDSDGSQSGHTFLYKWMNDEIRRNEEKSQGT